MSAELKAAVRGLLSNSEYLAGEPIPASEPLVVELIKAIHEVLSSGLAEDDSSWWELAVGTRITMACTERTEYVNPASEEQVTKVLETADKKLPEGILWLVLCLNAGSLLDSIDALFKSTSGISDLYTPQAFMRDSDHAAMVSASLRPLQELKFVLDPDKLDDSTIPNADKARPPKNGRKSRGESLSLRPTGGGATGDRIREFYDAVKSAVDQGDEVNYKDDVGKIIKDVQDSEQFSEGKKIIDELVSNEQIQSIQSALAKGWEEGNLDGVVSVAQLNNVKDVVASKATKLQMEAIIAQVKEFIDENKGATLDEIGQAGLVKFELLLKRPATTMERTILEESIRLYKEMAKSPAFEKAKDLCLHVVDILKAHFEEIQTGIVKDPQDKTLGTQLLEQQSQAVTEKFKNNTELHTLLDEIQPILGDIMGSVAEIVCSLVPSLKLPRIHGVYDSPVGNVSYHIGNISFSHFMVPTDKICLSLHGDDDKEGQESEKKTREVCITDVSAKLEALMWQYGKMSFPLVSGHGEAKVAITGADVRLLYDLDIAENRKKICINVQGCHVSLKNLEATIDNATGSWMYNLLLNVLNKQLREMLDKELTRLVTNSVNDASALVEQWSQGIITLKVANMTDKSPTTSNASAPTSPMSPKPSVFSEKAEYDFISKFVVTKPVAGKVMKLNPVSIAHLWVSTKHHPAVVFFKSSPGDAVPPLVKQLADKYGNTMMFGLVNVDAIQVQTELKMHSKPGILFIPTLGSGTEPMQFQGEINLSSISKFLDLMNFAPGFVTTVEPLNVNLFLNNPLPVILCLVFSSKEGGPADGLLKLAMGFRDTEPPVVFGFVRKGSPLLQTYNLQAPAVMCVPPSTTIGSGLRPEAIVLNGDRISFGGIASVLKKYVLRAVPGPSELTSVNLPQFLTENPGIPKCVLFTGPKGGQPEVIFRGQCKKFNKKMEMAIVGPEEQESLLSQFDIQTTPCLIGLEDPCPGKVTQGSTPSVNDFTTLMQHQGQELTKQASFVELLTSILSMVAKN